MSRRNLTLGEYLVRQVGWRTAPRVLGLIVAWSEWLRTHDGEAPTIDVLAGNSDKSRSQWFRDQAAFRKAFPGDETPDRIARLLLREKDSVSLISVPMIGLLGR